MGYKFKYNEKTFCDDVLSYATRYRSKYERFYHSDYQGDQLQAKAELHAIYYYTLNLAQQNRKERGCFKKDLHRQLNLLKKSIPGNCDYFCSILKEMENSSIQEVLSHESKGEPKYKSRKFDPILIEYAETIYARSLTTYRQIHEEVNIKAKEHGFRELSYHKIKRHFAQPEVQNRLRPSRNGKEWYHANIGKQQHFLKPDFAGQLLEIDGSRLQIPFNNTKLKKIDFLTVFVIIDVTSSLVLGYAHGMFESSKVTKNAFRRFFNDHSFLPLQIIRDDASSFQKDFKIIEELTTKRGVEWVVTSFAQGKPHVENFYKTFSKSICSYHEHFIGLGITTSHLDSRITSKSKLKNRIGDREKLATYDQLVYDIDYLIDKYQSMMFDGFESAKMKFERLFNTKQIAKLLEHDKIAMTATYRSARVCNCEIAIVNEGQKHFYQIPGNAGENIKRINIAYDRSTLDEIYLFEDNLEFLMSVSESEKMPFLSSQRTSTQQQKYIREYVARETRYKKLLKDIKDKEDNVNKAFSNSPSFEVLRIHKSKRAEVAAQNEFTRSLIGEEQKELEQEKIIQYPPNSVRTKVTKSLNHRKIEKWSLKSNG